NIMLGFGPKVYNTPFALKLDDFVMETYPGSSSPVEKGNPNAYKQITMDGLNIMLGFGPKVYNTPFALKLDDFVMETYPGSSSP
ncbi:hypothetical protein, partial [Chryseobacterium sp. CH25]|uniref:hypothetical protein n=1 Tax=Chryseobacterium sp. CH25 TaxID=713559 RepID=UPI001025C546